MASYQKNVYITFPAKQFDLYDPINIFQLFLPAAKPSGPRTVGVVGVGLLV